ncbi:heat shock 70 kDa protein 16-like isoform X1 [Dioscorea cayenensis subsp. rotundata]|uniref:Heat shock 70 kDa protein 16-like isoform X1 n=1 Tax=Dioscorea cayennensis subsp. rotundata TaxID=55577 RepID=A0AB40CJ41_DIOCR|nr:heat shock 70 kDa protein 16-like isoform X1 [Dioscorea cayenensis subsp. rotundata]
MSVVGFDVGNDTCVIATVRHGTIDVLLNDESKRETPSCISFSDKQRLIGSSASSLLYPSSTFSDIKDLLLSQPRSQHRVSFLNREITLTPVHLLAMLLSHLKLISERSLGTPVSDCVISVPSFTDQLGRRAYLHAAQIAGLKPLRLIHDTTATALGYGIYKTDFSDGEIRVVFVDVGHCDTQVSVVVFDSGGLRVLSHASDRRLGGRGFDEILFKHFSKQFEDEYKIDVSSNAKASIRLKAECEKVKKVLSANAEASMSIECLMDDKDVKGFIKREEFERLASGLLEKVLFQCRNALSDAGVVVDEVQSVELVGSASRIPAITRILSSFFGKEPSRTLNASECVARGCALQCAKLTPLFKSKNYKVCDLLPYSVGFGLEAGHVSMIFDKALVSKGEPLASIRDLSVSLRRGEFNLHAFYADKNGQPLDASQKITSFFVGPVPTSDGKDSVVTVRILLDISGIVTLDSTALLNEDDTKDPVSSDTSCSNSYNAEPGHVIEIRTSDKSEPAVDGQIKGRPSRRLDIPVSMTLYGGMTPAELSEAQLLEMNLAHQDKLVEQTKERKNELEAYVYEVRNKLLERYRIFATESEREGISKSLQQTEEWLYDEGGDETENVYTGKLLELKKLVDPVVNRFKDEEARPQAKRELLQCIVDNRLAVESLTTYERDAVFNECNKAEQWLRDKSQLQDSLPKNSDPVLWSHEINKMTASLDTSCRQILKHRAPHFG